MPKYHFYSQNDLPKRGFSPAGSPYCITFREDVDANGAVIIVPGGVKDQYKLTQESKPDDIYTILKKTGVSPQSLTDLQNLRESFGKEVADFTSAPKTIQDALSLIIKGNQAYESLNPEIRKEFVSGGDFVNSMLDGSFDKRIERFLPKKEVTDDVDNK